jgi:hypothetical protein
MSLTKERILSQNFVAPINVRSNETRNSDMTLCKRLTAFIFYIVGLKAVLVFKTNFKPFASPKIMNSQLLPWPDFGME